MTVSENSMVKGLFDSQHKSLLLYDLSLWASQLSVGQHVLRLSCWFYLLPPVPEHSQVLVFAFWGFIFLNTFLYDNSVSLLLFICSVVSDSLRPQDCSPPGSSVHGILQARILEWITISSSRGSSPPRDQTHVSCIGRWVLYQWATRKAHFINIDNLF